uniref:F-box protein 40 n=1 Tax=Nothobranchius furzeri TaxID=105023 RepID=A0A8C6NNQ5_NOTFU
MSRRSRASRLQQHLHCDSCFSLRCRSRVEASTSCAVSPCRLLCGAVFHLCKEEDHLLLCPNVRVPCLNAAYGCLVQLPRSSQAAHLQVCPASAVCCSMEWLRWPVDDTNPHSFNSLQDNVMMQREEQGDALDVAMALADQSDLYSRLKMKPLYPELTEEEVQDEGMEETAAGGLENRSEGVVENCETETNAAETAAAIKGHGSVINLEKYNLFEMMFNMEKGACALAQENLENPKQTQKPGDKEKAQSGGSSWKQKDANTASSAAVPPHDTSKTGLAPWQEGVLERLGQELTPQEYNMYMVHHGRMLLAFGQIEACTPREKDFVYGSLEPIPVQTLHSFKVPDSYRYRRRIHLYETAGRVQTEPRGVDTSHLDINQDDWFGDEAAATLLGYAEQAVMGHKISETKGSDGLYVDVGTQTHFFRSAPFAGKTTLADVMENKPLKLLLQFQAESVSTRNNKASCVFTFLCGHTFLRREFATHYRNVHSDIQMCLSGWFEQRCPLAYLGCTYSHRRFHPSTHEATVTYNQQLKCFNLRPKVEPCLDKSSPGSSADSSMAQMKSTSQAEGGEDSLSSLPYEVLVHMASFLDSLSLFQLALVSRLMRQVCSSLLQERGMVTLRWEKISSSHGSKWRAKPVWEFSHLFSSVDSWHMAGLTSISAHLKVCPYYQTSDQSKPVPLPSMSEEAGRHLKSQSLIKHFPEKRSKN